MLMTQPSKQPIGKQKNYQEIREIKTPFDI